MTLEDSLKDKQVQEEINKVIEERRQALKDEADQLQFTTELNKLKFQQEEQSLQRQIDLLQKKKELSGDEQVQLASAQGNLVKLRIEEENRNKTARKMADLREQEKKRIDEIKTKYLGLVKADETRTLKLKDFTGKLNEVLSITKTISKEDARATFFAKLEEAGTAALKIAQVGAKNFNQITSELNKATNTSGKYNDAVRNIAMSNARFGINAADAAKAVGSLHNEFSDFSNLSEEVQTSLTDTTTKLEKAGISADAMGRFMNTATKSMGMSAEQTAKYTKELVAFAHVNGISTKVINDGLASVMPRLTAFGSKGPAIFKEMAFRSKELGIEMGKLLDITEQFTTFEGAAEAAGNLNSVLGGNYIDTLELLRASSEDPVKAQDMLRDALQKTGKSFDQLSGQQRRMFASMLGMDLNTAGAFFKKTSLEAKEAADAEKTFNDAVASFIPIGEKLTAIGAKMAPVFQALASVLETVVDIFVQLLDLPGATWLLAAAGAALTLTGIIFGAIAVFGTFLSLAISVIANVVSIGIAFGLITPPAAAAGAAIAAAGGEAAAGGAGFAAASGEIAAGSTTAAASLVSFTAAVTPLIPALLPLAAVLLALGAAFFLTGLGIGLVLIGVAGIVLAFVQLIAVLIKGGTDSLIAAGAFLVLAYSISVLAGALVTLGTVGTIGLGVLGALAAIMIIFGASFLMVGQGMAMAKEGFDAITNFEITKLENIRNIMKQMADHMQRMTNSAIAFSSLMSNPLMLPVMTVFAATKQAIEPATKSITANNIVAANTTAATESGTKEIKLVIDSPIYLDKYKVGKFVHETMKRIEYTGNENDRSEPPTTGARGGMPDTGAVGSTNPR